MKEKTCVITGANSGLGYETAKALAEKGAEILMICRSEEKGKNAQQSLVQITGNKNIHLILADLSSQKEIQKATATINERWSKIDVLVNNSATVVSQHNLTEDGIETQFAVNHLGYFYMTHCLIESLLAAPEARIVNISSGNHAKGKIHFEDVNLKNNYHVLRAYNQSKLANVLFTYELHRQCKDRKITSLSANAVDPGTNITGIGNKNTNFYHGAAWRLRLLFSAQKPSQGAETQIYLASAPELKGVSGKFWFRSQAVPSAKISYREDLAAQLWQLSKSMCNIEDFFGF